MEEKAEEKLEDRTEGEKNGEEESLPFCTTAPSAEHARAEEGDEPCDDFRSGE
jgi:hypothetical protein